MRYSIESQDNITIFSLKNKNVNSEVSADLKAEMLILCQPDLRGMILDLSEVEIIDSSGLGAILLAYRQLNDNQIPMMLVGVQENVYKIMEISQISGLFDFFDNIKEALECIETEY